MEKEKKKDKLAELRERAAKAEKTDDGQSEVVVKKLAEILESTDKIRYVHVEYLNCKLPYKILTIKASSEMSGLPENQRIVEMLFHMLRAADETITREQVEQLPFNIALKIVKDAMAADFLPKK